MTFEEQHYKEREVFAKINRLRDAVYSNQAAQIDKESRRQDFGQQVKSIDELVSFKAQGLKSGQPRGYLLQQGRFDVNLKRMGKSQPKDHSDSLIRDKGGKSVVQERMTWDTGGYQEQARPTATEQQLAPPKLPSLRDKKNGRYPRQLQNTNQALFTGNGRK